MGSDMLLWFRNWAAYRELLRRVVLVAHLRTGEDAAPVREYAAGLAAEGGTVLFAKAPVFPVSSTEVRALAAKGRPLDGLVPESVAAYIVPPYTVFGGNPARLLKRRFSAALTETLLRLKWWDLEPETLAGLIPVLCSPDLEAAEETLRGMLREK